MVGTKRWWKKLLDQYQADPEDEDPTDEKEGLIVHAALEDQISVLYMLIKRVSKSMSISRKEKVLQSALYYAVIYSAKSTTRFLLGAGVNINNYEDQFGNGLYIASKRGDLETVQLLVDYGWATSIGACSYEEGMHVAAARGTHRCCRVLSTSWSGCQLLVSLPNCTIV